MPIRWNTKPKKWPENEKSNIYKISKTAECRQLDDFQSEEWISITRSGRYIPSIMPGIKNPYY
jgi:hypothetical protein